MLAEEPGRFNLAHPTNPKSYRELLPWHDVSTPHRTLIRAVGYEIVFGLHQLIFLIPKSCLEAQQAKPISISSVLSLLLLCKHRDDCGPDLLEELSKLSSEILHLGFEVLGWVDSLTDSREALEVCCS